MQPLFLAILSTIEGESETDRCKKTFQSKISVLKSHSYRDQGERNKILKDLSLITLLFSIF